ncbi:MAG TPA: nicotinamide riboside transporter PnuC [Prolixibacteraceae bacterium]|nr:nicotinamide riboside transporter PnuC [Prolixibacteraceae bacterium]
MTIFKWFLDHYVEVCGALTGLLYLGFSIRQHSLTWPAGLLNALFYIAVFLSSKIYADMTLQFYYVAISIYGWWSWHHGSAPGHTLEVSTTGIGLWLKLMTVFLLLFAVIAFVLVRFTDTNVPYWDAVTTAMSIIATWMLARKKIEHWLVWVVTDAISIGLFIFKELYPTTLLFLVYTILAVYGYFEWKKDLNPLTWKTRAV